MPSIFGFAAIALAGAVASVDCHLRGCCVRLRERWMAFAVMRERVARMAQRGQAIDMMTDVRCDGNGMERSKIQ